jgi:hypothetical protein
MKLVCVSSNDINVSLIKERYFQLISPVTIKYTLDGEGVIHCNVKEGFEFDFRSGPKILDYLIPHFNDSIYNAIILGHDAMAWTDFSFDTTNELFKQGLLLCDRIKMPVANLAYSAVSAFKAWHAQYNGQISDLVEVRWSDK